MHLQFARRFKRFFWVILFLVSAGLFTGCGEEKETNQQNLQPETNSFTFFEIGKTTRFSKSVRKALREQIGRDAIEYRNLINLETNYDGFLQSNFPDLAALNRQLNSPTGERVEHDTFKLMYRYAKKKKQPFDYVEIIFSDFTKQPILIKINFKTDEANTLEALKTKYGEPAVIDWEKEGGKSLHWQKDNDILLASLAPDQFGRPRYQIMIYFTDAIRELIAKEQKEKANKDNLKSGKTAF